MLKLTIDLNAVTINAVCARLEHDNGEVRDAAVGALAQVAGRGNAAAIAAVYARLEDDDDEEPKEAPKPKPKPKPRPKKPTGPRGDMPLVLTAGAGRDGKRTLMVELDSKAGGFGVDTGAIGRASFPRVDGKRKFRLDLRGQEYDATIRPCATMMVLNVAGAEARVETVISEYATIKHTHDATTAYDQDFGTYAGDANVNARRRRGDSDGSDSDAAPQKKKPKKKPAARKRKPAARKKK